MILHQNSMIASMYAQNARANSRTELARLINGPLFELPVAA